MAIILDVITFLCLLAGSISMLIGGYGLLKLPDVFARMHAAGMVDTLGVGLIVVGLMFQAGFTLITFKLFLIIAFVFYTSPVVTHALAHACLSHGVEPRLDHPAQDGDEPS
jgi:multicomponent Na+:H+ antiporter subunit G